MKHLRQRRGFSLIELMVAVAVVGILAAIAYPSYKEQVARTRRGDARAVLLEDAQWMERQFTVSNSYKLLGDGTTAISSSNLLYKEAPKDPGGKYYDITVAFPDATNPGRSFVLSATPKGTMLGDKCGTFTLSNTGAKGVTGNSAGTDAVSCWSR